MHILYRLTFQYGKCYIGQTVRTMERRFSQHRQSAMNGNSQLPVHCAWRKHGEPTVEIIGEYENQESLHRAEIEAIRDQNTLVPNGYNLHFGGTTAPSLNPMVAEKIGSIALGRKYSDTSSWSKSSKKQWEDPAYRERVSEGLKSSWTEEMRHDAGVRSSERWAKRKEEGWVMPESQKQRMRDKVISVESRAKMSASAKARSRKPFTEETKAKLSEATKDAWANRDNSKRVESIKASWDEESRAEMSEKAKNTWKDPEVRAKRIAAMKAAKLKKG